MKESKTSFIASEVTRILGAGLKRLILFGSQARKEQTQASDYDLLVVVDDGLDGQTIDIATKIRKRLAAHLIDADVLVRTESEAKALSANRNSVTATALREGMRLT